MCKILVAAKSNILVAKVGATPEEMAEMAITDRRGCYKKGYPVVIKPDTWSPSRSECPPSFVVLECPEVTEEAARAYNNSWEKTIDYNIISSDPVTGNYQVEVFGDNTSVSGDADITLAQVDAYLSRWGATVDSNSDNSVTFTLALWQTLQTEGFWEADVSGYTFNLNSYDSGTGIASVTVSDIPADRAESASRRITEHGGSVTLFTASNITFDIERSVVLEAFKRDVKEKIRETFCRKQYYFSEATVDAALAVVTDTELGTRHGHLELTQAELMAALNDKLEE